MSEKSICHIGIGKDKVCQSTFKGKYTSNLIAHLRRFHKQEYEQNMEREQQKKCVKSGIKRKATEEFAESHSLFKPTSCSVMHKLCQVSFLLCWIENAIFSSTQ